MSEDPRWDVELHDGEFHDVGATRLDVDGGCLVFYDANGAVLVAYSARRWVAVNQA
jgi:hypothetical protein